MTHLLPELASKAHAHQPLPFLGAGCSLGHVNVDWDGIANLMAARLTSPPSGSNAEISEAFVREHRNHRSAIVAIKRLGVHQSDADRRRRSTLLVRLR
jgi:hypothetical protein